MQYQSMMKTAKMGGSSLTYIEVLMLMYDLMTCNVPISMLCEHARMYDSKLDTHLTT
jgi:hypothetical protein